LKIRMQTWLALIVVAIGLVLAAILGLFAYVSLTATPLHPDPQQIPSVTRQPPSSPWAKAVEQGRQRVRAGVAEQNLPGVSVAVGADGEIVWAEGFGYADLEQRAPVRPETRFRIGNVSNTLTSAAVGLLVEKNQLNLEEEIQKYVPAFPKKQWPVTVRQLMGQVAGVRNDAGDEEPLSERCDETVDGLRRFRDASLRFQPGTQYRASSYGWILVSAAVEAAAGYPFFTFMRTQIFAPLGMTDTTPDFATQSIPNRATFYFPRFAGDNRYGPEPAREGDHSCFAGAGAFLSTASDLVRFGMALTRGKLLQPATVDMLQTPQRLTSGEQTGYGLGWSIETVPLAGESTRMVGHGTKPDFIGGTTSLMIFPERGLVVAMTSNISFADTKSLALSIAQAFAEPTAARPKR
jgi:serine beta-lactamase-like protein LACTB, mitochondrial